MRHFGVIWPPIWAMRSDVLAVLEVAVGVRPTRWSLK
jgi:hypothetical protein